MADNDVEAAVRTCHKLQYRKICLLHPVPQLFMTLRHVRLQHPCNSCWTDGRTDGSHPLDVGLNSCQLIQTKLIVDELPQLISTFIFTHAAQTKTVLVCASYIAYNMKAPVRINSFD